MRFSDKLRLAGRQPSVHIKCRTRWGAPDDDQVMLAPELRKRVATMSGRNRMDHKINVNADSTAGPVPVGAPGVVVLRSLDRVSRRHVDLQRVSSALCRA